MMVELVRAPQLLLVGSEHTLGNPAATLESTFCSHCNWRAYPATLWEKAAALRLNKHPTSPRKDNRHYKYAVRVLRLKKVHTQQNYSKRISTHCNVLYSARLSMLTATRVADEFKLNYLFYSGGYASLSSWPACVRIGCDFIANIANVRASQTRGDDGKNHPVMAARPKEYEQGAHYPCVLAVVACIVPWAPPLLSRYVCRFHVWPFRFLILN